MFDAGIFGPAKLLARATFLIITARPARKCPQRSFLQIRGNIPRQLQPGPQTQQAHPSEHEQKSATSAFELVTSTWLAGLLLRLKVGPCNYPMKGREKTCSPVPGKTGSLLPNVQGCSSHTCENSAAQTTHYLQGQICKLQGAPYWSTKLGRGHRRVPPTKRRPGNRTRRK